MRPKIKTIEKIREEINKNCYCHNEMMDYVESFIKKLKNKYEDFEIENFSAYMIDSSEDAAYLYYIGNKKNRHKKFFVSHDKTFGGIDYSLKGG